MPKSTLALKSTVIRRQAEPVPPDMAERLRQLQHHEAAEVVQVTVTELVPPEQEKSGKQLKREAVAAQSAFLTGNLGRQVTVFTLNGVKLVGRLKQFDQFTLLLEGPSPMLVFKHAISTVAPASRAE